MKNIKSLLFIFGACGIFSANAMLEDHHRTQGELAIRDHATGEIVTWNRIRCNYDGVQHATPVLCSDPIEHTGNIDGGVTDPNQPIEYRNIREVDLNLDRVVNLNGEEVYDGALCCMVIDEVAMGYSGPYWEYGKSIVNEMIAGRYDSKKVKEITQIAAKHIGELTGSAYPILNREQNGDSYINEAFSSNVNADSCKVYGHLLDYILQCNKMVDMYKGNVSRNFDHNQEVHFLLENERAFFNKCMTKLEDNRDVYMYEYVKDVAKSYSRMFKKAFNR